MAAVAAVAAVCATTRPAAAQWIPAEGTIRIARGTVAGAPRSIASAEIVRGDSAGAIVGTDGPCVVHRRVDGDRISAGAICQLVIGLSEFLRTQSWDVGPELRGQLDCADGVLQHGWQLVVVAHLYDIWGR